MKLKSFKYLIGLLIIFFYSPLSGEEKIDIWKNKKEIITKNSESSQINEKGNQDTSNLKASEQLKALEKIQIQESATIGSDEQKIYGLYEPANYDFDLNMWSTTKAEDLRLSLKRLNLKSF